MAQVTMLKDQHGSADHIRVTLYKAGQTYDMPDDLAKSFVEDLKVAELGGPRRRAQAPVAEAKMDKGAPENKSAALAATVEDTGTEELLIAAAAKKTAGAVRR